MNRTNISNIRADDTPKPFKQEFFSATTISNIESSTFTEGQDFHEKIRPIFTHIKIISRMLIQQRFMSLTEFLYLGFVDF